MATHKDNKTKTIKSSSDMDVELNKGVAALSYVWVLCFVPLFLKRDSKFAQFHAKQGLLLFAIEMFGVFVFWIPILGWLLFVAVTVLAIMGVIRALSGEWWEMPYIYNWSQKINL
jgi:uncharacterized membrane protein